MSILQGTIPDDWDGEYCRYAVCWPNSPQWLAVLRGVLALPARGRFWDEDTGSILTAQSVIRETYDTNLHLQEVILACNDQNLAKIATAIMALAAAQCCTGDVPPGGGIQITIPGSGGGEVPFYGTETPIELEPAAVPPGYEGTYSEFKADQCNAANELIRNWAATIRNLGRINFAQTNGLIVVILAAVVGLIALPPVMVPILIGYALISVLTQNMWFALADGIEANAPELVCALIQHGSVLEAFQAIEEIVENIVTALGLSAIQGAALKMTALLLVNADTLNKIFSLTQAPYPAAECNCDICVGCLNRLNAGAVTIATLDSPITEWLQLSSEFSFGAWNIVVEVNTGSWVMDFQNINNWTITGFPQPNFQIGQEVIGDQFQTDSFESFAVASAGICLSAPAGAPFGQWFLRSATAFTVEVKTTSCE